MEIKKLSRLRLVIFPSFLWDALCPQCCYTLVVLYFQKNNTEANGRLTTGSKFFF